MIDIHHHLLFGLDDGSPDLKTSVAMCQMAVADGITHIVCTPHASGSWAYQPEVIAERLATLRSAIAAEFLPLTLGVGCDFHLSYDNINDAIANPAKFAINGAGYLLVELPDYGLAPTLTDTFYQLRIAGMTPILTHPERNPTLQRDTERLADWLRNGMIVQITANSVLGKMGKEAERMSHRLLSNRWVHVVATDAHNLTSRPPRLSEARDLIASRYGDEYAQLLCTDNPRSIFQGEALGPQPEPLHLFQTHEPGSNWLKRLFGR